MAQHPGVPWDQRPDYLTLTQRVDPTGTVTAYNPPRRGLSATDVTSFVYGQANITVDNWPEVMYYLTPTREWLAFRSTAQPPQKLDANGHGMVERFPQHGQPPRPLLDFTILPDTICSQEELWWIELWRRMDPRIHWQDIIMRIELPNRTIESDKKLQNATNNLINRHEHRLYFMLAWHSTGVNGMRANEVRTWVMDRVAAANPPLPPNSTRGLTPGLINPLLGNVSGNVIGHPTRRENTGRLRVTGGRPTATQAATAATNQGHTNAGPRHPIPSKRNRTSPDHKGRWPKRQAQDFNDDSGDDNMDTGSDGAKKNAIKKKPNSERSAAAKKAGRSSTYQRLEEAQQEQQEQHGRRGRHDSATENDREYNAENSEEGDPRANQIWLEGDPGFEEAFQATRRNRSQAQDVEQSPRRAFREPPRRAFSTYSPTNRPIYDDSDSGTLGQADSEGRTLVPSPSDTTIAPQQPSEESTPAPRRQARNPLTGQAFRGSRSRRGALGGYESRSIGDRGSPERSSEAASSNLTEDDGGHTMPRLSNIARLGLPTTSVNRPPQNYHHPAPSGSHTHHTDAPNTHPTPSGASRVSFARNQRAAARANTPQSTQGDQDAQPTTRTRIDAPNSPRDLTANNQKSRLIEENARHSNALVEEWRRRQQSTNDELSRHARAIRDINGDSDNEYATGFLARETEKERRERQPSSDDE